MKEGLNLFELFQDYLDGEQLTPNSLNLVKHHLDQIENLPLLIINSVHSVEARKATIFSIIGKLSEAAKSIPTNLDQAALIIQVFGFMTSALSDQIRYINKELSHVDRLNREYRAQNRDYRG